MIGNIFTKEFDKNNFINDWDKFIHTIKTSPNTILPYTLTEDINKRIHVTSPFLSYCRTNKNICRKPTAGVLGYKKNNKEQKITKLKKFQTPLIKINEINVPEDKTVREAFEDEIDEQYTELNKKINKLMYYGKEDTDKVKEFNGIFNSETHKINLNRQISIEDIDKAKQLIHDTKLTNIEREGEVGIILTSPKTGRYLNELLIREISGNPKDYTIANLFEPAGIPIIIDPNIKTGDLAIIGKDSICFRDFQTLVTGTDGEYIMNTFCDFYVRYPSWCVTIQNIKN